MSLSGLQYITALPLSVIQLSEPPSDEDILYFIRVLFSHLKSEHCGDFLLLLLVITTVLPDFWIAPYNPGGLHSYKQSSVLGVVFSLFILTIMAMFYIAPSAL